VHAHAVQQRRDYPPLDAHHVVQLLPGSFHDVEEGGAARDLHVPLGEVATHRVEHDVQGLTHVGAALEPQQVEQLVQDLLQHVGAVQEGQGRHQDLLFVRVSCNLRSAFVDEYPPEKNDSRACGNMIRKKFTSQVSRGTLEANLS
jgi:hypothetical protein